jgi:hypothetical protein
MDKGIDYEEVNVVLDQQVSARTQVIFLKENQSSAQSDLFRGRYGLEPLNP